MWLCTQCDERLLDTAPVCPLCGGTRAAVGRTYDPDREPLTHEEQAQDDRSRRAAAALSDRLARMQAQEAQLKGLPGPFSRTAARAGHFLQDLRRAYSVGAKRRRVQSAPQRPVRDVAWVTLAALLAWTVVSLAILTIAPTATWVPLWLPLGCWIAAVLLGRWLIHHELESDQTSP
jgi:hypothetical protein